MTISVALSTIESEIPTMPSHERLADLMGVAVTDLYARAKTDRPICDALHAVTDWQRFPRLEDRDQRLFNFNIHEFFGD